MRRIPVLAGLAVVLAGGACATRSIAPIDLPAREIAGHYAGGVGAS